MTFDPLELSWWPELDQCGTMPAHDAFASVASLMATWPDELERERRFEQALNVRAAIACLRDAEELELADVDAEP